MQDTARRLFVAVTIIAWLAAGSAGRELSPSASHAALRPAPQSPQKPQSPTFKARVDLVAVDVRVTDAQGRFVNDLTKDEFEVLEDGKPQTVSTFERIDIPVSAPAAAARVAAPPEVRTNAIGVTGRLYLLVLDDVNTYFERSGYVQKVAREFIEKHIEPGDVAGVAFISGRRNVSQDFTSDRQRLLKAVEMFSGLIPPPGAISGAGGPAPVASGRGAFDTLRVLAEFLGTMKGRRKACVYIGEGFKPPGLRSGGQAKPGGAYTPSEQSQPDRYDYEELAAAANRANVNIYTVDPRGLSALAEGASAGQLDNVSATEVADNVLSQQDGMAWLAYSTGGFSVANMNNFTAPFTRIQRDQSSYYLLGYSPPGSPKEGSSHKIVVRARRPGVTVRARREYFVPKTSAPTAATVITARNVPRALLPALDNPVPSTGIRFSMMAAPFKGAGGAGSWASVVMQFDGRDLDLGGTGGLDIAVIAVDRLGKIQGNDVRRVDLAFDPATRDRVLASGLRVQARVRVPKDTCTLRVAVADGASERVGSMWVDLAVPDFDEAAISLSGLLVTDSRAPGVPTANVDEDIRKLLPAPPSTERAFFRNTTIAWMAEVYRKGKTQESVNVATTIVATDGTEVFRREVPAAVPAPTGPADRVRVSERTSLEGFLPGDYVLKIEARLAGSDRKATREIAFRVMEP
jgi:VWFA-related protein